MAFRAGQTVTAGQLDRLQPRPYYAQAGTGTVINTTGFIDLTGCTVTLDTTAPNAVYVCTGNFSYDTTAVSASGAYTRGVLNVDGVLASGESRWSEGTIGGDVGDFDMAPKTWSGALASAGSHTFTLQAALNSVTGSPSITATGFSDITVIVYEVP